MHYARAALDGLQYARSFLRVNFLVQIASPRSRRGARGARGSPGLWFPSRSGHSFTSQAILVQTWCISDKPGFPQTRDDAPRAEAVAAAKNNPRVATLYAVCNGPSIGGIAIAMPPQIRSD